MKHKLFSFSAILAAILSLTACGSGESAADVNYSEIAASDGSLVFTTSSTPEISTEPSVEPIIPSSEILEETSTVPATESTTITTSTETVVTVPAPEPSEHQELKVHFLDVGQGDSCFIELPNKETMLIDAGESEYGDSIVTYIYGQGYGTLDYVVATHPHADHIGGMAQVLETFPVEHFYMGPETQNTSCYADMLEALEIQGIQPVVPSDGDVLSFGSGATVTFLGPADDVPADNLNNRSLIALFSTGAQRVLFMGDAESAAEQSLLAHHPDLSCDRCVFINKNLFKLSSYIMKYNR